MGMNRAETPATAALAEVWGAPAAREAAVRLEVERVAAVAAGAAVAVVAVVAMAAAHIPRREVGSEAQ